MGNLLSRRLSRRARSGRPRTRRYTCYRASGCSSATSTAGRLSSSAHVRSRWSSTRSPCWQATSPTPRWDPLQLLRDFGETIPWLRAVFAGVYIALYTRFAAQFSYLANVYNQMMATQAMIKDPDSNEKIRRWKTGLVEDAQDLHLATKPMFATIVWHLLLDEHIVKEFDESVSDGSCGASASWNQPADCRFTTPTTSLTNLSSETTSKPSRRTATRSCPTTTSLTGWWRSRPSTHSIGRRRNRPRVATEPDERLGRFVPPSVRHECSCLPCGVTEHSRSAPSQAHRELCSGYPGFRS